MYLYNKIAKHKNINYYVGQNNVNSKNMFIIADLHKIPKYESCYESIVAWFTKSKNIEWNDEYENIIDKNLIKNYIINL